MPEYISSVSIIVALVALVLGMGLSALLTTEKTEKWAKRFGITLLSIGLGFVLAKTTETWLIVRSVPAQEKKLDSLHVYMQGLESVRNLPNTPFRDLASQELTDLDARLKQIASGRLQLRREEIIRRWEMLIRASSAFVDATNLVSAEDWGQFSPNDGIEVHKDAVLRGIRVRRIFIYDERDEGHVKGLLKLAKPQMEIGVEVRKISLQWVRGSSFLSEYIGELGTEDIVLFDDEALLMTDINSDKKMTSAMVTIDRHKIRNAREFYDKLWKSAAAIK